MFELLCLDYATDWGLWIKVEDLLALSHNGKLWGHAMQRSRAKAIALGTPQHA
jgi:hypothetical protein